MRKSAGSVRLSFIRPMEPELVEQPPMGEEWSHEVKFDGYRTQAIKDEQRIHGRVDDLRVAVGP